MTTNPTDPPSPQTWRLGGTRCLRNRCERGQKTWLKAGSEQRPPDAPPRSCSPCAQPRPAKTPRGKAARPTGPRAQLQPAVSSRGGAQTAQACWTRPVLPQPSSQDTDSGSLPPGKGREPGRGRVVAPPARRSPAPRCSCTCRRGRSTAGRPEVVRAGPLWRDWP